ncbi:MAG: thioredoxin-like domain-containing protein [Alistipes sp.]
MRKIFILAVTALTLYGCTSNKCVIKGDIEGLEGTIYLFDETGAPIDSTIVEQGKFKFAEVADTTHVAYLVNNEESNDPFSLILITEPGKITVSGKVTMPQDIHATGTPANEANTAYSKSNQELSKRYNTEGQSDEQREKIKEEFTTLTRKTMEDNLDNYLGVALLTHMLSFQMTGSETLEAISKFAPELQQSKLLTKLKKEALEKQKTEVGQHYLEIIQNDPTGKPISLSSVIHNPANKYVLVDFWATWCHPCMGEVPFLIADYEKYHAQGFEIYGVSFDIDRGNWMQAIEKRKMNWIHVSDLHRFDNAAARDYAVKSIPSNFLIESATGKIVAVNLRGEALAQKLAELLP